MENVAQRRVRAQVQLIDKLIRRISSQSGSNILHAKLKKGPFMIWKILALLHSLLICSP